jgi:hypothetical protein
MEARVLAEEDCYEGKSEEWERRNGDSCKIILKHIHANK